jgi:hypothetical protein
MILVKTNHPWLRVGCHTWSKPTTKAERNRRRSERIRDAGHLESREDDCMWQSPVGALQMHLQTVIDCNTPKTVCSRNVVAG